MTQKDLANLAYDAQKKLSQISDRLSIIKKTAKFEEKENYLKDLKLKSEDPNFWQSPEKALKFEQERSLLFKEIENINQAQRNLNDYSELFELIKNDEQELLELFLDIEKLDSFLKKLEIEKKLSGPHDKNNAILSINVGQGGVDAADFAEMLLRMYKRYGERNGFLVTIMDVQPAEEAGIKNATILISGEYAYGYLKSEIGVHRLVRISPFDSNARRHTSFASVWVIPEIEDDIEVEIKPDDLRIDTFRAGGAGGQHVNKTDSAVRITHLPTNTVVVCQSERSQIKNRSTAMKLLKARLYELEKRKRLALKDKAESQKLESSFGSQIRNYVLAPYRLVKDLRTNFEVGNVDAVLDGDIQPFIDAYLLHMANQNI